MLRTWRNVATLVIATAAILSATKSQALTIVNGDFSSAITDTGRIDDLTDLTTLAPGSGWYANAGNRGKWIEDSGNGLYTAVRKDDGAHLIQVIDDDKNTTGTATLMFDVDFGQDDPVVLDLSVWAVGWDDGDDVPETETQSSTFADREFELKGGTALITQTGVTGNGELILLSDNVAQNGYSITEGGGFDTLSVGLDFGTGFDNIGLVFMAANAPDNEEQFMEIRLDNVSIQGPQQPAIPEPATAGLALLGLTGLVVRRRRA